MSTPKTIESRAAEWALGENTGSSSKSIAKHMLGLPPGIWGASYPHDGGDLGRCLVLLDQIPEWRARLPEMAKHSRQWAALVGNWAEIEEMHRVNHPKLYERMRAILAAPEQADSSMVRVENVSFHFAAPPSAKRSPA